MGDRNPFSAKLVMTKDKYIDFKSDRNVALGLDDSMEYNLDHFLLPWRSAAYFDEFDANTERYAHETIGDDVIVYLNGHSKVIDVEFLKRCCKLYTDKFAFLVFLCDGEHPSFYSIGLGSVEFDMDGLGTLRYSTDGFYYTNELNAPDVILVGVRQSDCGGVVGVPEDLDYNPFASCC